MDDLVPPDDQEMDDVHISGSKYITVIPVQYPRAPSIPGSLDYEEGDAGHSLHRFQSPGRNCGTTVQQPPSRYHPDSIGDLTMYGQSLTSIYTHSTVLDICVFMMNKVGVGLEVENGHKATAEELCRMVIEEDEVDLPSQAEEVFAVWMTSPLLEIQLKPHHKPFRILKNWNQLIDKYSTAPEPKKAIDEPILSFQRNVFFSKKDETKIKDGKVLGFLFEEAKTNILDGRYSCEMSDYEMLAGIQARLEMGPYNPKKHTILFFRERINNFLPKHCLKKSPFSFLSRSVKRSPEAMIIDHYRAIPLHTNTYKLVRKYIEYCWALPFYGSAFFRGQIEKNCHGLTALLNRSDVPVWIAINSNGVYVIDITKSELLLGVKHKELAWEFARPSQPEDPDCLPCLFIQFKTMERGRLVSKVLQIFSKQAVMMDALITTFVQEQKHRRPSVDELDAVGLSPTPDSLLDDEDVHVPLTTTLSRRDIPQSCLSNKLSRLSLATFDENGQCIGHSGSWSFGS